MRIIEIKTLDNGAHRNQGGNFNEIPNGWAVVPDEIKTPSFPFGEVEFEEIDGVMTITKWIAGTMPEIKEVEEPVSEIERLRADIDFVALMKGVDL